MPVRQQSSERRLRLPGPELTRAGAPNPHKLLPPRAAGSDAAGLPAAVTVRLSSHRLGGIGNAARSSPFVGITRTRKAIRRYRRPRPTRRLDYELDDGRPGGAGRPAGGFWPRSGADWW